MLSVFSILGCWLQSALLIVITPFVSMLKDTKIQSYSILSLCYNPRLQAINEVNEIPFQGLFCVFWRNVHAEVPEGLHELPEINTA